MAEVLSHLKNLSVQIGARPSTSENERKAAEYIRNFLEELNLKVHLNEFSSIPTFTWVYVSIYLIALLGVIIYLAKELFLGFFFTFLSLILFLREIHTKESISPFLPKKKSQNVWAEIPPAKEIKKEVIIVAHYDTSLSGLMFAPKFVKNFRSTFLLNFISLLFINFLIFIGLVTSSKYFALSKRLGFTQLDNLSHLMGFISLLFILPLLISILLLLHRELFGIPTNGANDNASGVSVMLKLAEYFSKNRLNFTKLTVLATGSEEVGLIGILNFLKKYKEKAKESLFLNLDNCGIGKVKYIIREGMIKTYPASEYLIKIAEKITQRAEYKDYSPFVFKTMLTDATACLARGLAAMSIMAFDEEGLLPHWHWRTDEYEKIEEKTLNSSFNLAKEIIKEVDKDLEN